MKHVKNCEVTCIGVLLARLILSWLFVPDRVSGAHCKWKGLLESQLIAEIAEGCSLRIISHRDINSQQQHFFCFISPTAALKWLSLLDVTSLYCSFNLLWALGHWCQIWPTLRYVSCSFTHSNCSFLVPQVVSFIAVFLALSTYPFSIVSLWVWNSKGWIPSTRSCFKETDPSELQNQSAWC